MTKYLWYSYMSLALTLAGACFSLVVQRVRERLERPVPLLGPVPLLTVGALLGIAFLGVFGRGIVHRVVPPLVLLAVRAQRLDARDGEPLVLVERPALDGLEELAREPLGVRRHRLEPRHLGEPLDVLCVRFDRTGRAVWAAFP